MKNKMELKQYVRILWKWLWLLALSAGVAAGFSYWATIQQPKIYRTKTSLLVGQVFQNPNPQAAEFYTTQRLALTYVQIVKREPVMKATVEALGFNIPWQALAARVNAQVVANTQLLEIYVLDTDPQRAKITADEIAKQLILQSPTAPRGEQAAHREFIASQLQDLEKKIKDTKASITKLQQDLALENSARAIQDTQNQIAALQGKINLWRQTYAQLLVFLQGGSTNFLSVVEPASVPTAPIGPRVRWNVMLAAALGLSLALGAVFLLEYLDDTVKTGEDVQRALSLPTLGAIFRMDATEDLAENLITVLHPRSPISEAYRVLRTNLQFSSLGNPSTSLLITSASPAEGKTTTAANLSVAMAQAGKRVILVDSDLRRPSLHKVFGVPIAPGLTSLLVDQNLSLEETLVPTGVEGLWLITSGPIPPNPSELLATPQMVHLIERLTAQSDMVVCDSPPLLAVADASILAAEVGGTIVVINAGRTRTDLCRRAADTLEQVGARVLGVVLNKLTGKQAGGYYYYYGSDDDKAGHRKGGKE